MFINAQPRFVSSGFETFVPKHRTALQQRLGEMTNNDINAWGIIRPRDSSTTGTWDQQLDDFSNENFPAQSLYSGYFQDITSQGQAVTVSKPILYSSISQGQCQPQRRLPVSQNSYQARQTNMNCIQRSNPMLGEGYSQMSRGSFAEFSTIQAFPKDFNYQPSMMAATNSFTTCDSSSMMDAPYLDDTSMLDASLNIEKISPSTVYSGYSTSSNSTDPGHTGSFNMVSGQAVMNSAWWPENSQLVSTQSHILPSHDGLPNFQQGEQQSQGQFSNPWRVSSSSTSKWASPIVEPRTISPKALSLNFSSVPLSLSTSSQGSMAFSDSSTTGSIEDDESDFSAPEVLAVAETEPSIRRPRQILPDSGSVARLPVPVVPSNDYAPNETAILKRSIKLTTKSASQPPRKTSTSTSSDAKDSNKFSYKLEMPTRFVNKRLEPKLSGIAYTSLAKQPQPSTTTQATHQRDAKDDFLVRCKLAGMSYKEIRRKGKFTEAESTLRGRFRTLTKAKAARVRKPEWNDNDIRLLKKAVRKLTPAADQYKKAKVPWKQVAEYIADNGGSYHFGNATCRKRWDELQADS